MVAAVKVVGMMRLRNEARWIERVLESIRGVCSEVHVLDDHSTDGTGDLCRGAGAIVHNTPFAVGLNETRDKNFLLDQVRKSAPEWVLHIDGDEELAADGPARIAELVRDPAAVCYHFRVLYLWDSPEQYRRDGVYGRFRRESLFRLTRDRFSSTPNGGNFHCGNSPRELRRRSIISDVRLLHYGYMDAADRIRKYGWYNSHDPRNAAEDGYRHMVIGDVFPAESVFRFGGPLDLAPVSSYPSALSIAA